jgi:hypothetical protein
MKILKSLFLTGLLFAISSFVIKNETIKNKGIAKRILPAQNLYFEYVEIQTTDKF